MTCLSLRVLHYCICLRLTCTPGCVCVCVCVCVGVKVKELGIEKLKWVQVACFLLDFKIFFWAFWSLVSGQSLIFVPGENYSNVSFFILAENITLPCLYSKIFPSFSIEQIPLYCAVFPQLWNIGCQSDAFCPTVSPPVRDIRFYWLS